MEKGKRGGTISRRLIALGALILALVALLSNPGFFPFLRDAMGMAPAETSTPLPTYTALPSLPTHTAWPTYTPPATATLTDTATATDTPTDTPTNTATSTNTATFTPYPTYTELPSQTPLPTHTAYPTYTPPPTATPTNTPTDTPTNTATSTNTATFTPYPTYTELPSQTPLPTHTAWPTNTPRPTYTLYPTYTQYPTNTPTSTPTNTPSPTPIPPSAVLAHIQAEAKAELVVTEYELVEREFHVGVSASLSSYGGYFVAQGTIEAGLDLTELDGENIVYDPDTQSYTLLLPSPQLTKCDVEYIRLTKIDSLYLLNPDFDRLRLLGEVQVMGRFVDRALERGIIEDAKDSAALILEDLVRTFTGKQVRTEYEARRGKPGMDTSCQPRVSGWTYNINTNVWNEQQQ